MSLLDDFKETVVGTAVSAARDTVGGFVSKLFGNDEASNNQEDDLDYIDPGTLERKRGLGNAFSINEFRAELNYNGILRQHSYLTIFNNPAILNGTANLIENSSSERTDTRFLTLRCDSVTVPGVNFFTTEDIRRYGYGPIERRPYLPTFNPITLSFVVDKQAKIIEYFYAWTNGIVDHDVSRGMVNDKTKPYFLNYKSKYISKSMSIWVYDENFMKQYLITLRDVYPITISDTPLSWGNGDLMRFNVTLQYTDMFMRFKGSGLSYSGQEISKIAQERPEFSESKGTGFLGILEGFVQGKLYEAEEKIVNKILNIF